ncbi:MAG: methyl-accepting chemotaxis protein [Desulfovibrionaceae bacterium]
MFKNLKLGQKLGLGFGLVLILTAVVAWFGFSGLSAVEDRAEQAMFMTEVSADMLLVRRAEKNYMLHNDQQYVKEVHDILAEVKNDLVEARQMFDSEQDRGRMQEIARLVENYRKAFDRYVEIDTDSRGLIGIWRDLTTDIYDLGRRARNEIMEPAQKQALERGDVAALKRWSDLSDSFNVNISRNFLHMRVNALYYILRRNEEWWARFRDEMDKTMAGIDTWSEQGEGLGAVQNLADNLRRAIQSYIDTGEKYHQNILEQQQAQKAMTEQARNLMDTAEAVRKHQEQLMDEEIQADHTLIVIASAVALVLGVLAAFFITTGVTRPVRRCIETAERLAKGDMEQDVAVDRKDEIGSLLGSIRELLEALKGVTGVVTQLSVGDLNVDLTPRSDKDVLIKSLQDLVEAEKNAAHLAGGKVTFPLEDRTHPLGE